MIKQDNSAYSLDEPNKIYILGSRSVGKTTLFNLFFNKPFDENIRKSEVGIINSKYIYNKKEFTLKDLTDDENYSCTKIMKNELEDVLLVIVLFSLDDQESYKYAQGLISFINNNLINNKEMQIILIGNKLDLITDSNHGAETEKYEKFASSIDNCSYYEVSCKKGQGIQQIKKIINDIEIPIEEEEDNGKLSEEERKKIIEEIQNKKCIIF